MGELKGFAIWMFLLSIVEQLAQKASSLVLLYLIAHFLSIQEIGFYGIALSYMAFVSIFAITPESVLLRDYSKYKKNLDEFIKGVNYFFFWRLIVIIPILAISAFVYFSTSSISVVLFFVFYSLVFLMGLMQSFLRDLLYLEKKYLQGVLAIAIPSIGLLLAALSLILFRDLAVFGGIVLAINLIITAVFLVYFYSLFKVHSLHSHNSKKLARKIFFEFGIWNHINSNITGVIYKLDPLILSVFAVPSDVGLYTIALLIANYFMVYPMQLQKTLQMTLARVGTIKAADEVLKKSIIPFFGVAVLQLIGFILIGQWLIPFFTKDSVFDVYLLSVIIVTGITLLNFFRPYFAYLGKVVDQRELFFWVYLPSFVVGVLSYVVLTYLFGKYGTAMGNVFAYLGFAFFLFLMRVRVARGEAKHVVFEEKILVSNPPEN